jgi:hypothetical protein
MVVPTTVTVAQVTRAKTKLVAMKSLRIVIPQVLLLTLYAKQRGQQILGLASGLALFQ